MSRFHGLLEGLVVFTFVALAGWAPFSIASMTFEIIVIESPITLVAEVGSVHESFKR